MSFHMYAIATQITSVQPAYCLLLIKLSVLFSEHILCLNNRVSLHRL